MRKAKVQHLNPVVAGRQVRNNHVLPYERCSTHTYTYLYLYGSGGYISRMLHLGFLVYTTHHRKILYAQLVALGVMCF